MLAAPDPLPTTRKRILGALARQQSARLKRLSATTRTIENLPYRMIISESNSESKSKIICVYVYMVAFDPYFLRGFWGLRIRNLAKWLRNVRVRKSIGSNRPFGHASQRGEPWHAKCKPCRVKQVASKGSKMLCRASCNRNKRTSETMQLASANRVRLLVGFEKVFGENFWCARAAAPVPNSNLARIVNVARILNLVVIVAGRKKSRVYAYDCIQV